MKRIITILLVIVVLVAVIAVAVYQWQNQRNAAALSNLQVVTVSRGSLTSTIGATGVVHSNQTAFLAWQTSGKVEKVNVGLEAQVTTDQVLAALQKTSLAQNIILAQAELISAQKTLEDLQNSKAAQAQALRAVIEARRAVIEAERALDVFELKRYEDDLEKAEDSVVDAREELDEALEDLEPYEDRSPDNETRKDLEEKVDEAQRDYDEALRKRDLLLLDKQQAEATLQAAEARLEDAQREYERLKDGPHPDDIAAAEARIAAAQAAIDLARITAPFDGAITSVKIKPGDQVGPGTVAFQVDDLSQLSVDVKVSEVDINRIKVGQEASLSFDAILDREYSGVVVEVDRVGTSTQGVVDFTVRIELTDADENVKPGMTAAVNIIVEQLENALQVPNRAVRVRDGRRVVYILRNNQLATVEITLGASSESMSEVVDGKLQSGDQVVLNPPLEFEAGGPPAFVR